MPASAMARQAISDAETGFHVAGATPEEHVPDDLGPVGIVGPLREIAMRHDIDMAA